MALPTDPQALAEHVTTYMYNNDPASQALGARITHVAPGAARMSMTVRADMLNGHKTCHGGFIFALADSTFAFACNSRNLPTVAAGCSIDYVAPAFEGDQLEANATEYHLAGRTGVYDVEVTNQQGQRIAIFRGRSYRLRGAVIEDPQANQ